MKTFLATLAGVVIGGVLLWFGYQQYNQSVCRSEAQARMKTYGFLSEQYETPREHQACAIAGME